MEYQGNFVFVDPTEEGQEPFWLRTSDIVGVKPVDDASCILMRHATVPLHVKGSASVILHLIFSAENALVRVS